jgi:ribonuclease J
VIAVITVDRRTGRPVGKPEIASRGFVDGSEGGTDPIISGAREQLTRSLQHGHASGSAEPGYIQNRARDALQKYIYQKTKRRPMVLSLVVEV